MKKKESKPLPVFRGTQSQQRQSSAPQDYTGVDLQFYTKSYDMSEEDKKLLVRLVQYPEFKVFEKYMDWRINLCAHRMKENNLTGKSHEAMADAAEIDAIVKITQHMQKFWHEVKSMEKEKELEMGKGKATGPKLFGDDRYLLTEIDDEAIQL